MHNSSKHNVKAFKLEEDEIIDFVFEIIEEGLKPRINYIIKTKMKKRLKLW